MDEQHKQPEGASRQAVGALIGAVLGFGIAARKIFSDFESAGQVPWVEAVGITIAGGVVGLIVATLLVGKSPDETPPAPPRVEDNGEAPADDRVKPADGERGITTP
jgi:hypothetical protein